MQFAITGSSGFVGRHLVQRWTAAGHQLACVSRQRDSLPRGATLHQVSSYRDISALTAAFTNSAAVVHLAARAHILRASSPAAELAAFQEANVTCALAAARAALLSGCPRFVLVSSIGVNGNNTNGYAYTEHSEPKPQEAYARSKHAAELAVSELLRGSATACTIVRPTLVYGAHCPGNFKLLVRLVQRLPVVPFGALNRKRSFIGVQNLCDALEVASIHPACADRIFLLSDGEDLDVASLSRLIATGLGVPKKMMISVPEPVLSLLSRWAGRGPAFEKLAGELLVDSRAFQQVTGWRAALPAAVGVAEMARSFASAASAEVASSPRQDEST